MSEFLRRLCINLAATVLGSIFGSIASGETVRLLETSFEVVEQSDHFKIVTPTDSAVPSFNANEYLHILEKVYTKLNPLFPDPVEDIIRKRNPIHIVIFHNNWLNRSLKDGFLGIYPASKGIVDFIGYYNSTISDEDGTDIIFLDVGDGDIKTDLQHMSIHELQHLFLHLRHPKEELWINEGLSEHLAWRLTQIEPLGATIPYLNRSYPLRLVERDRDHYGFDNYGQSYLFFRFIYDHYAGDSIFKTLSHSPRRGQDAVVAAIASHRQNQHVTFANIYKEFVFSLFVPEKAELDEKAKRNLGFRDHPNLWKKSSNPSGVLPGGFSFAAFDVTFPLQKRLPIVVKTSEGCDAYAVQYRDGELSVVDAASMTKFANHKEKTWLVIINPSTNDESYEVTF